jgi:purine nucleosidase
MGQPDVPQYAAISHLKQARPVKTDAVDFMREVIRSRPGEIELLSIGPLTNVAALFALDPETPSLLRGFTSMAGSYFDEKREHGEWNMIVDPVAAAIAFRGAARGHRCVGLDVTQQVRMGRAEVEERFAATPVLRIVLDMAITWFEQLSAASGEQQITFHDPLAAAVIFEPSLCTFEPGRVRVDYGPEIPPAGNASFALAADGRHRVARTVDVEGFFAEYFSRTSA